MKILNQKGKPLFPDILWKRAVHSYSGSSGKLLIIAGSGLESKEALLTSEASFQSGTGRLTLAFPESLEKTYRHFISKEMLLPLKETPSRSLSLKEKEKLIDFSESNSVSILGPGLSKNSETSQLMWELIFNLKGKIVVSDDAIRPLVIGLKLISDKEGKDGVINKIKKENNLFLIIKENDLLKINYSKSKIEELILNFKKDLNISVISIGKEIINLFEDTVIKTELVKEIGKEEVCVLSGIVGSFISQNPEETEKSITAGIYVFTKSLEKKLTRDGKSLVSYVKETIKEES